MLLLPHPIAAFVPSSDTLRSVIVSVDYAQVIDAEIPQVQVAQGQEPLHFRRLFGQGRDHGRLIVHDRVWRKRDNPEKRVSLFKVQRMSHGEFQAFQVKSYWYTRKSDLVGIRSLIRVGGVSIGRCSTVYCSLLLFRSFRVFLRPKNRGTTN